jgi:hypothetical protein
MVNTKVLPLWGMAFFLFQGQMLPSSLDRLIETRPRVWESWARQDWDKLILFWRKTVSCRIPFWWKKLLLLGWLWLQVCSKSNRNTTTRCNLLGQLTTDSDTTVSWHAKDLCGVLILHKWDISSYHWTAAFYEQARIPCFLFSGKQSVTISPLRKSRKI